MDGWTDGWMDGWMDGWKEKNTQDDTYIALFTKILEFVLQIPKVLLIEVICP